MREHKGIYYFPTQQTATAFAATLNAPTDRIIKYGLGWAIQWHRSGAYVGPQDQEHKGCAWCMR
jgi:hypothetical protein